VEIETDMTPRDLKFRLLRRIESELGRTRSSDKFSARTIDLDLILYDDLVTTDEDLTLPAPGILHRSFLAVPLHELAPGLVLPGSGLHISAAVLTQPLTGMIPLENYTEQIRKEILHEH
jgi:7,8-dihydro-6-hydroxymethylpterin-pyrophosphokinase